MVLVFFPKNKLQFSHNNCLSILVMSCHVKQKILHIAISVERLPLFFHIHPFSPITFRLGMWFYDRHACLCLLYRVNIDLFCICRPSAGYGFMEWTINNNNNNNSDQSNYNIGWLMHVQQWFSSWIWIQSKLNITFNHMTFKIAHVVIIT
jgi:hypothetical protein